MARKYIQVESLIKPRKVFIDDLRKIHKRRQKVTPSLPRYEEETSKSCDETKCLLGDEMIFESLTFELGP